MPGGQYQTGLILEMVDEPAAPGILHAQRAPFGQGLADRHVRQGVIETGRQAHLLTPGRAALPVGSTQVIGGGRQGVGLGVPDIPFAVAVEVDRVLVVGGRDELGLTHGPGPGAGHVGGRGIPALADFQRRQQLGLGKLGAAPLMGQGSQGAYYRAVTHVAAEVAFQTPDRHQDMAVNAVAGLDLLQRRGVPVEHDPSGGLALGGQGAVKVFPDRTGELGLTLIGAQDRWVRFYPTEGLVEYPGLNARSQGAAAEVIPPLAERP